MQNSDSIQTIFIQNHKLLKRMLYRIVQCQFTAEDLAQEAYIRFEKASSNQLLNNPQSYLYRIAKNLAFDHLRKERVRNAVHTSEADSTVFEEIPSASPDPSAIASHQQRVRQLLYIMQDLPVKQRQILILRRVDGLKIKDIAGRLRISESAVEKNLRIALTRIINALDHTSEK